MQSRRSFFNKTIFKKNIIRFWPVWGIYTLILLYMLPLKLMLSTTAVNTVSSKAKSLVWDNQMQYVNRLNNAMNPFFIFIVAVICAMTVFFYMYQTKSANMFHALPFSRTELYVTNAASGMLFLILPQILTGL